MPSDIQMTVDFAEFGQDIARLAAATRRSLREVVEQQSRLIIIDLMKSTPPTGNRPLTESFAFQRRKGESMVERDVTHLFQPLTSIRAVIYPQSADPKSRNVRRQYLRSLAERGLWTELTEQLFQMHVTDERVPIQETLTSDEYYQTWKENLRARGRRVYAKNVRRVLVWESSAFERVKREMKGHVGWAKSGWMEAARHLGVKHIPSWIADKPGPGGYFDETSNADAPAFTIINSVAYISYLNSGNRLLVRVLNNRERAMEISLEHAIDHFVEDFNAAQ